MLISLFTALVIAAVPGPPPPDPDPSACYKGWCPVVTYVAYDIDVPAVDAKTGKTIAGMYFTCHVPVRWKGKPNRWGHMTCILRKR